MSQFNFRFQKILNLKENEKGFAQIQMADAIKQEEAGYRKNDAIHHKLIDAERLRTEKQQNGINISEMRMLEMYIQQLQEQSASSHRELEHLQNKVTKTQTHLQNKVQEEKTWGNLKQQDLTQFEEKRKAAEQIFFDELASTRFYRTSKTSTSGRR